MSKSSSSSPSKATSPGSPTSSTASYSSPLRRRFGRQTRREAFELLMKSHRNKNDDNSHETSPAAEDELQQQQQENEVSRGTTPDTTELSLVQRQAKVFGGTVTRSRHVVRSVGQKIEQEAEKKSSASRAGTTVTTASSTTVFSGYAALHDDSSDQTPRRSTVTEDDGDAHQDSSVASSTPVRRKPQHLETHDEEEAELKYYRITYPGVVALLSKPDRHAAKSGAYVSYGEIIASRYKIEVDEEDSTVASSATPPQPFKKTAPSLMSPRSDATGQCVVPDSPPWSVLSQHAGSVSSLDTLKTNSTIGLALPSKSRADTVTREIIRVDDVLTGGYAVDAGGMQNNEYSALTTPKRSNTHYLPMAGPSPLPLVESMDSLTDSSINAKDVDMPEERPKPYGFLYTRKKNATIVERISAPPVLYSGSFLYSIVSSSPLPILTGPCLDAPKTKAMLLPGTVQEVCLKIIFPDSDVSFLRLAHRRGWITDRRVASVGGTIKIGSIPAAVEITDLPTAGDPDDSTVSALSVASSTFSTPGSLARRRHRPPRRKRDIGSKDGLPFAPVATPSRGRIPAIMETPVKIASHIDGDKTMTPSSNVSLLSDEESFEVASHYKIPGLVLDDRRDEQKAQEVPTLFLMRVNAPRGLKILDAPHFQVSNLIHGNQDISKAASSSSLGRTQTDGKGLASASKGYVSIFQTMPSPHATKWAVPSGSTALFDSVHKTRVLPRGVVFEASKRMEKSGAFANGAGLIKLADNSGWAIVPTQEELDEQYRSYRGDIASIKEGEATRAYEEVGNAIVDIDVPAMHPRGEAHSFRWLRIVARHGVEVSCPPPAPLLMNDEDTSPTSSTGGSSSTVSGGGSNYGILSSHDSDVASSVGSAFLDAMFRTPKKGELTEGEPRRETATSKKKCRASRNEPQKVPTQLPCGTSVQVDRWCETDGSASVTQEYVRLRGGQGWIPLKRGGKTAAIDIPPPDVRLGSFWFRVLSTRGIKVRLGASRKAESIKSDEGEYFRFECGEFLRSSEIVTFFRDGRPTETFAKLYRNRHVLLDRQESEFRPLASLTSSAEWVQVHGQEHLFLEECGEEPRIQRHREGWRYNAVSESGVLVRVGPSFAAEKSGLVLLAGESVLINERVTAPGERMTWLRLKNGKGWVHDVSIDGEPLMIAHSLRHRVGAIDRPVKADRPAHEDEVAYNSIIARLFHGSESESPPGLPRKYVKK